MRSRLGLFIVALFGSINLASAETITVSAAISLKPALAQIAEDYRQSCGDEPALNYGSSGQLLNQIAGGAEVDVFIPAAMGPIERLAAQGLADAHSARVVAGNVLVLVVPAGAENRPLSIEDLASPRFGRIAIGDPKTVPAGQYTEQVFETLKLTDAVRDRLVYGANVRQVLDYVARGEVGAGLVYATDARDSAGAVEVVARAQADWHDPIVYPAAIVASTRKRAASQRFVEYLAGPAAQARFRAAGFSEPPAATTQAAAPSPATLPASR